MSDEQSHEDLKKVENSWWGYFIRNRRIAILLGLIFLLTGIYSYFQIPRESFPEIKIPTGIVSTSYPGASPQEVAEQVTDKIEQKIKSLENIKLVTSSSAEGLSSISVQFEAKADLKESIRKLKDAVDEAAPNLPADASDSYVQEVSVSDLPMVTYSFFGDLPYDQLLSVVEDIQTEIEKVKGVQSANIAGQRQKNILISVKPEEMVQYGLNLGVISQAISGYNLNSPVGNLEIDNQMYRIRIEAEQDDAEKIKNIPISNKNGVLIYLKDVADVKEEYKEQTSISRVSLAGKPSFQALSISVVKKTGANIIETSQEIKDILTTLEEEKRVPKEVEHISFMDQAEFALKDFNNLLQSALVTMAFIFLIMLFTLGIREALIAGISIPFTFLVAFTFLNQTGSTFNIMVLFSLILSLGLLVDAAIVMMEGIHEYHYKEKLSPKNAALKSIKIYRSSLVAGLLTTISAFIPMLMLSGTMGEFFKFIPITLTIVLISALVIGIFFIPAYAVMLMKGIKPIEKQSKFSRWVNRNREYVLGGISKRYNALLNYLLSKRKRRSAMWIIIMISLAGAISLPALGLIKVEGFPPQENDFMTLNVEAPVGTTLEKLEPMVEQVEQVIQKDPNIASYVVNLGSTNNESFEGGGSMGTNLASFTLNFVPAKERTGKTYELAPAYKDKLNFITGAKINVPEQNAGPPTGATIQILIFGPDYSVLGKISDDIKTKLNEFGGAEVDDDLSSSTAEFTFDFSDPYTKAILQSHNLSVAEVAREVRMAVFPSKVTTLKRGEDEIEVNIQKAWENYKPHSIEEVKQIQIQNRLGEYVALGDLIEPKIGTSLATVKHHDEEKAVTITSGLKLDVLAADVLKDLTPYLESYAWPEGYSYELGGGNDEVLQSMSELLNAMVIGVILTFFIMVVEFNSFKQPLIILLIRPLALISVIFGFFFLQLTLSMPTMIGIVALMGIVTNDAIIMIDRINHNRRDQKMALKEAILEAGTARLQPIFINSITNILGILPLAFSDALWLNLGFAISLGMLFSSLLTLIVIPIFYYSTEIKGEKKRLAAIESEEYYSVSSD